LAVAAGGCIVGPAPRSRRGASNGALPRRAAPPAAAMTERVALPLRLRE
jgi:hypothetical protein